MSGGPASCVGAVGKVVAQTKLQDDDLGYNKEKEEEFPYYTNRFIYFCVDQLKMFSPAQGFINYNSQTSCV